MHSKTQGLSPLGSQSLATQKRNTNIFQAAPLGQDSRQPLATLSFAPCCRYAFFCPSPPRPALLSLSPSTNLCPLQGGRKASSSPLFLGKSRVSEWQGLSYGLTGLKGSPCARTRSPAQHMPPRREGSLSQRPPGSVRGGSEHPELPPGNAPARGSNFSECEFHLPWWDVLCGGRGERSASLGCPQSDRPAAGREGPAGRVAGPSSPRPSVRQYLSPADPRVGDVCLPAGLPPTRRLPPGSPGLEGEHRLLWTGKHGCCLSRDRGASLEGTRRPHILPPPSTFPKQPGLGWSGCQGWRGAGSQEQGRGKQGLGASRMR